MALRRTCSPPLQHSWYESDVDFEPPHGGTPFTFRCEREGCGRIKRESYGENSGQLIYRRYLDPPNWIKYPRGEAPRVEELRLEWIQMHIVEARKSRPAATTVARKRLQSVGQQ